MTIPAAPLRIMIVAVLCVLALIGLVVREGMARDGGTEIVMPMEAVDPRSLLSGNYVAIDLRESFPADLPCHTQMGDWIGLAPNGRTTATGARLYSLVGSAPTRAEANLIPDTVMARGSFYCNAPTPAVGGSQAIPGWISFNLGVDRFHIHQTQALRIEALMRDQQPGDPQRVFAILSVDADGRTRLKGLIVDNERLELNWL